MMISAIVLAAGLSRRMGEFKILLPWRDRTVVEQIVATLVDAGLPDILVVTGHRAEDVTAKLSATRARAVLNPRFEQGEMLSSIQAGLSARVAHLPGDPDEYVRAHGRTGFESLVGAAPALTEYLIDQAIQRHTGNAAAIHASVEQKIAIVRMLTPHAVALPDGLARSAFERRIAQRLALDVGALRAEVQRLAR